MDVTIRPARKDDAEALTTLAMMSKQSNGYDDTFMVACADELRVTADLLKADKYWVAESHIPCGFVCLKINEDEQVGEVAALFVHPDWQRRGVGRLLWATVKRLAREKNLTALHLDADPEAEAFYRKLGFSTIGRVPSASIPGRTLPHMRIDLPA
ncbi:GNAT family N-acetyltransferase [Roseovarius sp. Pro17]|uniref:GNAT family N-acetyltransferase n=1 Tax=Roseovarius sp. Pro17 TaxID=3108175 RepID=UPI002D777D29|nr:GNAT family N-acetyltransferase [Roseovarius sp. Pro17]